MADVTQFHCKQLGRGTDSGHLNALHTHIYQINYTHQIHTIDTHKTLTHKLNTCTPDSHINSRLTPNSHTQITHSRLTPHFHTYTSQSPGFYTHTQTHTRLIYSSNPATKCPHVIHPHSYPSAPNVCLCPEPHTPQPDSLPLARLE